MGWFRRDSELERELRTTRPEPREGFIRELVKPVNLSTDAEREHAPGGRTPRLIAAAGLTAALATAVAALGGFASVGHVADNTVGAAAHSVGIGKPGSPSNPFVASLVVYENPTVTIDRASGQADPTNTSPINFTVVFSNAVTGFTGSDVTISGTAGGTKTATVTGSGTTYNVAISGMTTDGTVIASIPAGVANAVDDGSPNQASSSTDNTVTYDATAPANPTVSSTTPASPNTSTTPSVVGTAEANSTVKVYTNNTCTSAVAGTGTATGGNFSIPVTVGSGATTSFWATATDGAGNTSACSTTTVSYTNGAYTFVVGGPGTQNAGTSFGGFTVQLQVNGANTGTYNNVAYTGAHTITFSGTATANSPGGNLATGLTPSLTFNSSGLATVPASTITLFKAQTSGTLTATDSNFVAGSTTVTVNALLSIASLKADTTTKTCGGSGFHGTTATATINVKDSYGNVLYVGGVVVLSSDTFSPASMNVISPNTVSGTFSQTIGNGFQGETITFSAPGYATLSCVLNR